MWIDLVSWFNSASSALTFVGMARIKRSQASIGYVKKISLEV